MQYKAAIFDMDGTILNTLTDLTASLNHVMAEEGYRSDFSEDETAACFGSGALVAMERALEAQHIENAAQEAKRIQPIFGAYYGAHCAEFTAPYPGILEMLAQLKKEGIALAVISNKADQAVKDLCEELFPNMFSVIGGIREGISPKPEPAMTEAAIRVLGAAKEETVYIGDSEIDIQTAKNAGIACIAVDWGFRKRALLETLSPAYLVSDPNEIVKLILS